MAPVEAGLPVNLDADNPGSIEFFGSEMADLFTKEIACSYSGVLKRNFVSDPNGDYPPGFLHASPIPQGWSGTFWTRDGGTFMRELALWGNFEHACLTADCLMTQVDRNAEGFFSFPEYFGARDKKSGAELDGTSSIIIGMVLLWQRLPEGHPFRTRIYDFLHQDASPVRYIHKRLEQVPLLAGSGEFGGGCGIPGEWCNVVQNNLSMLALLSAAQMEDQAGEKKLSAIYRRDARKLRDNMAKYLVDADGAWIWCIDPKPLKPDPAIVNHEINLGFGGLNGVACMFSDALGLLPRESEWSGADQCLQTFDKLYAVPLRREQFEKYGIWTQFDTFRLGLNSSCAYGNGYALQMMLLYDKMEMAGKLTEWIAKSTYENQGVDYGLGRLCRYYFCEQSWSPDAIGKTGLSGGCGPLNLVNVSEPLKAARLMLGVDDSSLAEIRIIPRVPPSWKGVRATNWPIRTRDGLVRAEIRYEQTDGQARFTLRLRAGQAIPRLSVRLPSEEGYVWRTLTDVSRAELTVKPR